jgi:hypothetical protein
LVPGEKFMLPPIEANKALCILVLRTLGQSQEDVAGIIRCREAVVGRTESWFCQTLDYREALVFVDDQTIEHIVVRELPSYGLPEETLERARQATGDDVLRHFRIEDYWANAPQGTRHRDPIQEQHYLEEIRSHWDSLLSMLGDLQGVGVFPPEAREILSWKSRYPKESEWPVSKGSAHGCQGGVVSVTLSVKDEPEWECVNEHLSGHPVLAAVDAFEKATEQDLAAKWNLAEELLIQVEVEVGVPVTLGTTQISIEQPSLTFEYLTSIYDHVFRIVAGLSAYPRTPDEIRSMIRLSEERLDFNGLADPLALGCDHGQLDRVIEFLINPPYELSSSEKAKAAGEAYHNAEVKTQELKEVLVDFLKQAGKEPDTRCGKCRPWFQALGME